MSFWGYDMKLLKSFLSVVLLCVSLFATPAWAAWRQATSPHFVVYGDMSEGAIREYAERLERYDGVLRLITGQPDRLESSLSRVTVYVLPGISDVQRMAGDDQHSVAGYYRQSAESAVAFMPERMGDGPLSAQTIMFHEYAHHMLMSSSIEFYPRWLNEGMAEFFMTTRLNADGSATIGMPNTARSYSLAMPFAMRAKELLASDGAKLNVFDVNQLYSSGWLLTHYLLLSPERSGQLPQYVKLLNQGMSWEDAAKKAFGDVDQLSRDMERYRRTSKLRIVDIPAKELKVGSIEVRDLRPGEAAIMPVRMRSANGVTEKTAPLLVPDARRVAALYPDDPFVQRALAEIEYDAKNNVEAEAAADRALALDPKMIMAMVYKGRVIARRAEKDKSAAEWAQARQWFIKANHVDPDFALPLVLYFTSFARAGEVPTPIAATGLMRAIQLVPQAMEVHLLVGRELVREDHLDLARKVLAPILFNPHAEADEKTQAIVKMIDDKAPNKDILEAMDKAGWNKMGD